MRWYEIKRALFEDRTKNLRRIFLEKLKNKFSYENLPDDIKSQIDKNKDFSNELFDYVMSKDPTSNKLYTQWLLTGLTRKKNTIPIQDIPGKATRVLTAYHERKSELDVIPNKNLFKRLSIDPNKSNRTINPKDINSFFTLSELEKVLKLKNAYDKKIEKDELDKAKKESDIIDENEEWIITRPMTEYAAQYWGRKTDWCTAYGDPKGLYPDRTCTYDEYEKEIFSIINKKDKTQSVQLHLGGEFRDYLNDEIPDEELESWKKTDIFKKISDYVKSNQDTFSEIELIYGLIHVDTGFDLSDETTQLKLVKEDSNIIEIIIKSGIIPEENVQIAAASDHGGTIRFILEAGIKPKENVQLAAVSQDGLAIYYILEYLKTASERVQLAAVSEYGYAIYHILQYLGKASEKVWLTAFKDNNIWFNIDKIYRLIIEKNIEMPPTIQLFIVKNKPEHFNKDIITDPNAIEYIKQNRPAEYYQRI